MSKFLLLTLLLCCSTQLICGYFFQNNTLKMSGDICSNNPSDGGVKCEKYISIKWGITFIDGDSTIDTLSIQTVQYWIWNKTRGSLLKNGFFEKIDPLTRHSTNLFLELENSFLEEKKCNNLYYNIDLIECTTVERVGVEV